MNHIKLILWVQLLHVFHSVVWLPPPRRHFLYKKGVDGGEREKEAILVTYVWTSFLPFRSLSQKYGDKDRRRWFEEVTYAEKGLCKVYFAKEGLQWSEFTRHTPTLDGEEEPGTESPSGRSLPELSCVIRGNVSALPVREGWALSGCHPSLRSWGGAPISCQST